MGYGPTQCIEVALEYVISRGLVQLRVHNVSHGFGLQLDNLNPWSINSQKLLFQSFVQRYILYTVVCSRIIVMQYIGSLV